jgi:excisionase family DNA binding protein
MADRKELPTMTYSRREAASYLGISPRTFDRIQQSNAIPYVMVGKRRRYLLSDLQNHLKSNRSI